MGYVVKFVSMADAGGAGDEMLDQLRKAGTDVTDVLRPDHGGSGVWMAVMNEAGDVAGSISQQPDLDRMETHIRSVVDSISPDCSALLLEIDLNENIAEYCIERAEESGVPVYAIVGNMCVAGARHDLLERCRCFICNRAEADRLFGLPAGGHGKALTDAIVRGAGKIGLKQMVVTLGGDGAVWYDGETGRTGHIPACAASVIDTTGAGDAFFSACVCALLEGRDLEEACRAGAALASGVISSAENACRPCPGFISKGKFR